jgi:CRP/FNR family cyclic AMP-dependent transcriptional regulator
LFGISIVTEKADPQIVAKSVLGAEMTDEECKILAGVMQVIELKDGDLLVKEGDDNNRLHLLAKGRIRAESWLDEKHSALYEMRVGELAGTRAFVDGTPRRATMLTVGHATLYSLAPADFDKLVELHPRLVYKAMRAVFRMTYVNLMRIDAESEQLKNYFFKSHGRY